jgi:hypothetical protein
MMHEVTLEQFLRWHKGADYSEQYSPTQDCPINNVTWYEAAEYCNALERCHESILSYRTSSDGVLSEPDEVQAEVNDSDRRLFRGGFLRGRFSGRILKSGEHLVPEAALEALADQNTPFTVMGKSTFEQQLAALRSAAATSVQ